MRYFRYFLTSALIAAALFLISSQFKKVYYDIPSLFKEADKFLLIFLVVFQAVNYLGGGWLFRILSDIAGFKIRLIDTFKIAVLGVAGMHIAPVFGGSIAIFHSFRKLKIPSEAISFLIPTWTFFIGLSYVLSFLISLLLLPSLFLEFISPAGIVAICASFFFAFIVLPLLFKKKGRYFIGILKNFLKAINKLAGHFRKKDLINPESLEKFIFSFYRYFDFLLKNKRKIPKLLLSSFLFYFGDILTLYFAFLVFGFHPNFVILILGYTISLLFTILALVPGTPGVMEASLMVVFIKMGFPAHIVLFSSLLFRLFTYWLPLPVGLFLYLRMKNRQ